MRVALPISVLLAIAIVPSLVAQQTTRDSALALFDRGEHRAAFPLLERLVNAGSTDPVIYGRYGNLLLEFSGAPDDPAERRSMRARGRNALVQAVRLGSTDPQVQALAATLPEDGGEDAVFSDNPKVQEAMRRAETAFAAKEMAAARAAYLEALELDPTLYMAAVFIGDTHLDAGPVDSVYAWYRRATEIDPDQGTAWRYWADILLKHDQMEEAREKAIAAVIANPYTPMTRQILTQWARKARQPLGLPRLSMPAGDSVTAASAARVVYDSVRAAWRGTGDVRSPAFTAAHPGDTAYRHSLAEELDALRAAGRAGGDDPGIRNIAVLDSLGLLEPFILIAGADAGIAQDYPAFRAGHREALRRFWREIVIGATLSR